MTMRKCTNCGKGFNCGKGGYLWDGEFACVECVKDLY